MRLDRWLVAALGVVLILAAGCSSAPANTTNSAPLPSPSVQPIPAPPVANASAMRDQLLRVAREQSTTDTSTGFGALAAWRRVFPRMNFLPSGSAPQTDTVFGGESARPQRDAELTQTVTFVVIDAAGKCVGGYMAGVTSLTVFDAVEPESECSDLAVYKVRNPDPPPEPEAPAPSRGTSSGKSSSGSGASGPTTRTGGIEPRPLGSNTVTRKLPGY